MLMLLQEIAVAAVWNDVAWMYLQR